jgi:hypothetical protein
MAPLTIPKVFMAGGAVGLAYYAVMRQYWFPNPYKTREVQNIEDRFSAGGGSTHHTPGAGTMRGDASNIESRQMGEEKGPQSDYHKKNISEQQSEVSHGGAGDEARRKLTLFNSLFFPPSSTSNSTTTLRANERAQLFIDLTNQRTPTARRGKSE